MIKLNIFGRIKELEDDVHRLQVEISEAHNKLVIAKEQIENLTENYKVLERINLYGRGDEPEVIIENSFRRSFLVDLFMRLYIDGEEFTIKNPDGLRCTCFNPIIKKSIMVNGDIATVVIQQDKGYEDIYHIEYDKGTYVHQVRRTEEEENKNE